MGGASIFRVRAGDANTNVIFETLTRHGERFAMAQRYVPEIVHGDKRVLLIEGEAVPFGLARVPAGGDARGNLAAGARAVPFELGSASGASPGRSDRRRGRRASSSSAWT